MVAWDEGPEHMVAIAAAHASGMRAYQGWVSQGWPEREGVAAAVFAGVTAYVNQRNKIEDERPDGEPTPWVLPRV